MTDKPVPAAHPATPHFRPIGVSGVVSYGGVLYPNEYEQAWIGLARDKTIQAMMNDPLIGAVLFGIESLVRRVDWRVEPADDSDEAEEVALFVQECLDDMTHHWPGDTLAQILTMLGWGFAVMEISHKRRLGPGGDAPSRFSDGRIGWKRWRLLPQATRVGWRFDEHGDATVLIQQDPETYRMIEIPLARCLHFRVGARDNSPEGFPPLRVAYNAWYFGQQLKRIEAIGIERQLAGLPVMAIPGTDIAENSAVYQAAQALVTGIRRDAQAGVVIASDRDQSGHLKQELTLLSGTGTHQANTDGIIKRYANEVVTTFLANVLRAGQDGVGTFALSSTQNSLFQQSLSAYLDTIADVVTEGAIGPLLRYNGIAPEMRPHLKHGDVESADLAAMGEYVVNLANAGMLEDTPQLRAFLHEVAGLPAPTMDELTARQEARDAAANEGGDTAGDDEEPDESADAEEDEAGDGDEPPARQAAEARTLIEDDGTFTLSDMVAVLEFWRQSVPEEYRDLLGATIDATPEDDE